MIGAYAGPATVLTALCAKAATRQIHTSIVHLQADQLCLWGATDISCFQLPPHFVLSYITGQPRWMRAPYHNYPHLLSVQLPVGVHDAHQLVLDVADLIPYKRRLGTPLRLITWMRMRTIDLEGSSRNTVAALKSPDPVQQLLRRYSATTEDEAKDALFAQFQLKPCDNTEPIPPALCQWLKELVRSHLHLKPLTLGIPVQAPFAPTMSPHHDALVSSLRTLVDIIMLGRPGLSPDLAPLAQHICETAATDSGHLVAVLSGVYLSLLTGRKALNIQGVFGAGKTRSVTLLMVWIAFSTEAKIIFLSKENPAGRAVEDLMEYFGNMIPPLKHKLSRILSAQESERYKHQKRPLVVDTKGSVLQTGEVGQALVATTGLVWSSKGNFRSRALQQAQEAEIIVVEEAQQTPDVKTTLSLSHADARSLILLVGDEQQAPGGIEDDPDLKHLRGPLLSAPIGLRALPSEHYRPPHAIPRVIFQLVATLGPLDSSLFSQHLTNICKPTSPLLIHAPMAARAGTGRAAVEHTPASAHLANVLHDALPLHLQDVHHAPPPLAFHSPTGTTLALLHLLGQADAGIHLHQASTARRPQHW